MENFKCKKCKYEWIPRMQKPKACPFCKSYRWDRDSSKSSCGICERNFLLINIHHINGDKSDNSKDNLIDVCVDCHSAIHYGFENKRRIRNYKGDFNSIEKIENYRKIWLNSKFNKEKDKTQVN